MRNLTGRLTGRRREGDEGEEVLREYCLACDEPLATSDVYLRYRVCPFCDFHYTLAARRRILHLADPETFQETNRTVVSLDPLSFSGRGSYRQNLFEDRRRTGLTEAVVTGSCTIEGIPTTLVVLDFSFLGGSMGSVVGEKVALAFEYAARKRLPLVAVVTSGGTRIQEGVLSLMQMAKTTIAATALGRQKMPFVVVMGNPTTGQVFGSFANVADVIIAEPGALVGLSPLRALKEGSVEAPPSNVHTAESQLRQGMLDVIASRAELKGCISVLLDALQPRYALKPRHKDKAQRPRPPADLPTAWQSVQRARHADRPTAQGYLRRMLGSFVELHGDRLQRDDPGVVCGVGYLGGQGVVVIGHERQTASAGGSGDHQGDQAAQEVLGTSPEGLRKAQRAIDLASRFSLALVTLIDTPGVAQTLEAEAHGIGNALATTIARMAQVETPSIAVITGEGGSEAALALGVANRILMLQNATFSPISPESAATLMYRDRERVQEAAEALQLTAADCYRLGIVDMVVSEPEGGAHQNPDEAARLLHRALVQELAELQQQPIKKLQRERHKKFRKMGEYSSYFRTAVAQEVDLLQAGVKRGVKRIGRLGRSGSS